MADSVKPINNPVADRQAVIVAIKKYSNVLIAVSKDPSVDELCAALGLTAIIDKMDKNATSIFSGKVPPAIKFLSPDKVFEGSADSLRDFIIAISKDKADHLKYKLDGDMVKIYITPYRTTIGRDDLQFSQGDYNVDLVIALGVRNQDDLDAALSAHGRIMHDAEVVSISAGDDKSDIGSVNWREVMASGLSELVAGMVDDLKGDQVLLDGQIATALLTGIVASTDRFSNNRTTSTAMSQAARLMSMGADQQLVTNKLEEAKEADRLVHNYAEQLKKNQTNGIDNKETVRDAQSNVPDVQPPIAEPERRDGELEVPHVRDDKKSVISIDKSAPAANLGPLANDSDAIEDQQPEVKVPTVDEILGNDQIEKVPSAQSMPEPTPPETSLATETKTVSEQPRVVEADNSVSPMPRPVDIANDDDAFAAAVDQIVNPAKSTTNNVKVTAPEIKLDATRKPIETEPDGETLTHTYLEGSTLPPEGDDEEETVDPLTASSDNDPQNDSASTLVPSGGERVIQPPVSTPAGSNAPSNTSSAAQAMQQALNAAKPSDAVVNGLGILPPPPPATPDFSTLPPDVPDFSIQNLVRTETPVDSSASTLPPEPVSNDPGQFHIPGQ